MELLTGTWREFFNAHRENHTHWQRSHALWSLNTPWLIYVHTMSQTSLSGGCHQTTEKSSVSLLLLRHTHTVLNQTMHPECCKLHTLWVFATFTADCHTHIEINDVYTHRQVQSYMRACVFWSQSCTPVLQQASPVDQQGSLTHAHRVQCSHTCTHLRVS